MGQIELFHVGRIPVFLDFIFIVLAALWTQQYWTSGDPQLYSAGFVEVIGLFVSILVRGLAQALAGMPWQVRPRLIEVNGMGGQCHFERSLPRPTWFSGVWARTVILLAGPLANLILWQAFDFAAEAAAATGQMLPVLVLSALGRLNLLLMIYYLLPAFPLDGGQVIESWLTPLLGAIWATRIVAVLGLCVALCLAWMGVPRGDIWLLLIALLIGMTNWRALESVGGFGRFRR